MANKATFSTEEWKQVVGSAFLAGFAVTAADPSGLWGLLKETFASGRALIKARSSAGANELMKAIVSEMQSSEGRTAAREYVNSRLQGAKSAKSEEIKTRAIETLGQAAAIVDQKAPSDGHISTNVAEASKEGGFLGFGGIAVSDAEKATLSEIKTVLNPRT